MEISPLNRYYLPKIIRQKSGLIIKAQGARINLTLNEFSPDSDLTNSLPMAKISELELLISWHQKLADNGNIYADKLSEIERDIFPILGLGFDGFIYVSLLNKLSLTARKYLGNKMVANYWKASQPNESGLDSFEVNSSGEIIFKGSQNTKIT